MPGYRGHLIGGAVAAVPLLYLLRSHVTLITFCLWSSLALIGSLFPDIDTKSKGQKLFYRFMIPVLLILLMLKRFTAFILLSFISFTPLIVNHRGMFHRLWFIILPSLGLAGLIAWQYPTWGKDAFFAALFFVVGAVSHLVLDFGLRRTFKWRW